jgi:hypothetical protein
VLAFEELLSDLYAIARKYALDEKAVAGARHLLALPRYAARGDRGPSLLAADIKDVISAMAYTTKGAAKMKQAAALYFNQEEPGTTLTHRRGMVQPKHGLGDQWMNRAVTARVLLALLQLDPSGRAGPNRSPLNIDEVHVTFTQDTLAADATETITYVVTLLAPGPQFLPLPFPPDSRPDVYHQGEPEGDPLLGDRRPDALAHLINWDGAETCIAGIGAGVDAGRRIRFTATVKKQCQTWPTAKFIVDRRIDRLVLEVQTGNPPSTHLRGYTRRVRTTRFEPTYDTFDGWWTIDAPPWGNAYLLCAFTGDTLDINTVLEHIV